MEKRKKVKKLFVQDLNTMINIYYVFYMGF